MGPASRLTVRASLAFLVLLGAGQVTGAGTAEAAEHRASVSAHRGGSDFGPPNSLRAVRGALEAGVRDVEVDVWFTSDAVAVLRHDDSLAGCRGAEAGATVTGSTLAALRPVRCGGRPIATLRQVAGVVRTSRLSGATLRVEAKHGPDDTFRKARADAALLARRVVDLGIGGRTVIADLRWRGTAAAVHGVRSGLRVSCLQPRLGAGDIAEAARAACFDLTYDWYDNVNRRAKNARIHAAGLRVVAFTINQAAAARAARRSGVDVIITDRPELVRRSLA